MEGTYYLRVYEPGAPTGQETEDGTPILADPILHDDVWGTRQDQGAREDVEADAQTSTTYITWRVLRLGLERLDHNWWIVDEEDNRWEVEGVNDVAPGKIEIDIRCERRTR